MAEFEGSEITIDKASVMDFLLEEKRKCIGLMAECKFMVHFPCSYIRYKFKRKRSRGKIDFSYFFFFFLFSPNEQIETSRRNLVIARHILMACFAGRTPSLPTLPFYHVHPKPAR